MEDSNEIAKALREEKKLLEESKDINDISDEEKDILRSLLKDGLL